MSRTSPDVSVVIPVYNGEKTLKRCLDSVLDQTLDSFEVIVVDNNSHDGTNGVIKEFQFKDERVKYVFEGCRSRGASRNAGIAKAVGEIIAMTDSDCVVPKNWLEEIIKPIVCENEVCVMGVEEDLIKNYWTENIQKTNCEFLQKRTEGKYISHLDTKNFAIKTSLVKSLMFDSELVNLEDFDFYLRLKQFAKIRLFLSIKVGHNHKSSLIDCIKINFNRGFWITKIYEKYKKISSAKTEPMFQSLSFINFITFPIWILIKFFRRTFGEAFFLLVSEISWRSGILFCKLRS